MGNPHAGPEISHVGRAPSRVASRMIVTLFTRNGCHLCDDAHQVLVDHGLEPVSVDVDADPELRERFNECVPVVEIDGKIRFRGRIDAVLLRRLIAGANS